MKQSKENNQEENGINQSTIKMPYQTPDLTEYGSISEIIKSGPGVGGDGFFFVDCTRS